LYWSYREPYKAVVYRLLDNAPAPPVAPKKKSASGEEPSKNTALPYQRILDTVNTEYPYPGEVRLLFPHQGDRSLEVEKIRVAGLLQLPTKDVLVLDVASGEVVRRKPFASLSWAEKFLSQVYSLHTGALLGNVSLGLFLLATLVGTSLPISGTLMWWNRQKSLRKSKAILARRSREKLSVPPFTNR
jgi:hypothetical protein